MLLKQGILLSSVVTSDHQGGGQWSDVTWGLFVVTWMKAAAVFNQGREMLWVLFIIMNGGMSKLFCQGVAVSDCHSNWLFLAFHIVDYFIGKYKF